MRQTLRKHGRDNRIFGSDPIPPSPWNYVGGAGTAEPPFQNGWDNAGGGLQRLRFRVTNEDQLEVEGVVTGGTAPVVTTLPDLDAHFRDSVFWPGEDAYAVGALGTADVAIWKLATNGELSIAGTVQGGLGTADMSSAGFIRYEFDNEDGWLHVGSTGFGGPENRGIALASDTDIYLAVSDGFDTGSVLLNPNTLDVSLVGSVTLVTAGGDVTVDAGTGGDVAISTDGIGGMELATENGNLQLRVIGSGNMSFDAGDDLNIDAVGHVAVNSDDNISLSLNTPGKTLTVFDSSANPIFRIDENGDVHIKSGGSILADL